MGGGPKTQEGNEMNLREAILSISYDRSWAIYADSPFQPESEARFGQRIFKNGGILDEKKFFCDGELANDAVETQIDPSAGDEDYQRECAAETLIEEIRETGEFDWGEDAD